MELKTLLEQKDTGTRLSVFSSMAWQNKYWAVFVPLEGRGEDVTERAYAAEFLERYDTMPSAAQDILVALWLGTENEKSIAIEAIQRTRDLWSNFDIMRAAVTVKGELLADAPDELKRNKHGVQAAVAQNPLALQYADKALKDDHQIALTAIKQAGMALRLAHDKFKRDRETVVAAVGNDGMALQFADAALQCDLEIAFIAVSQNGLALQFVDPTLQRHHGLVLAAVTQHGDALQFASDTLKCDDEIVFAAVSRHGVSLQWADESLQKDPVIIRAARRQIAGTLCYPYADLQNNPYFCSLAG